jgi:hypothetical protein
VNLSISPQIRLLALAGLLVAALGGGAVTLLGRGSATPTFTPVVRHHAPAKPAATKKPSATKHSTKPAAHAATGAKTATHAKPKAQAATHAKAKPAAAKHAARRGNLVDARLPVPLQWQLAQHKVVVVSLYDPGADVDAISVAEAHAGATDAKVGFLLVSLLDDKVAGPLTALLPGGGLLPSPGILVYHAPGRLVYRYDGFLDRAAVAQAAADAVAGEADPTLADATLAAALAPTTAAP